MMILIVLIFTRDVTGDDVDDIIIIMIQLY